MNYGRILKQIVLGAVLLTSGQAAEAQQLQASREHFSTEDGLCSNTVAKIFQDDYGYIWIGTWNGLSRFDGFHFYNYKTGNSSRIKNLHNRIFDMAIDQSQNIWLRMYDDRVFVLDRHTDKIINPFEQYEGNEEFKTDSPILVTSTGDVLVSINGTHLYVMQLDRHGLKSEQIATDSLIVTSMAEGYQSDIWLGTDKGIRRLNRDKAAVESQAILPGEQITCLYASGFNMYAGTINGAIYMFSNGKEPTLVRKPLGTGIISVFVDSQGLVWFCDDRMGLRARRNSSSSACRCPNTTAEAARSTRTTAPCGYT